MIEILFDQYQRYKKTQEIINKLRKENERFNLLEVGANEHRNLEKFLPNDQITYLDIQLSEALQNDPQYILGDATQMELDDNSYDFIIALDIFEHIPPERRKNFIDEINRVAKKGFILMGPFDTEGVANAEKNVNAFFKELAGYDHPWLVEHIQNGLPDWNATLKYLEEKNIIYTCFEHGCLNIWQNLMRYHFLSVYNGKVLPEVNIINEFYNEKVYPGDTEGRCYRKIIVGNKQGTQPLIQEEKVQQNNLIELNVVEAQFYKKLCNAYANNEVIELKDNHINNLEQMIQLKDNHIKNIESNIQLKDNHIENIKTFLEEKEKIIKDKDNHIKNIEDIVKQEDKELQLKDNHIHNIEAQNEALNDEIERLRGAQQKYEKELNYIYGTFIGKVLRKLMNRSK